jgi:thymidylate synthase ThyX
MSGRFLLPAASLANVGVTINARALEYAICKLLSSPLAEVRAIGERLRAVGQLETPTLIKYAACNPYLQAVEAKMAQHSQSVWRRMMGWAFACWAGMPTARIGF